MLHVPQAPRVARVPSRDVASSTRAVVAPFPRSTTPTLADSLRRPLSALGVVAPSRWVSVLALVVVASALRLWSLPDIPRYADEINEISPAFAIVRGQSFPLVSGPKHIGAAFDYLLA